MSQVRLHPLVERKLARVRKNVYDTECWGALLDDCVHLPLDIARPIYEEFFGHYPTSGRHWKAYLQRLISSGADRNLITQTWHRCLLRCLNHELWEFYLQYVERIGGLTKECFTFALDNIGHGFLSGKIYARYLTYLTGESSGSENSILEIRQVFHRALNTPMLNLEHIWDMYNKFEVHHSSHQTQSILSDRQRKYLETMKKVGEKRRLRGGLLLHMLPTPPLIKKKVGGRGGGGGRSSMGIKTKRRSKKEGGGGGVKEEEEGEKEDEDEEEGEGLVAGSSRRRREITVLNDALMKQRDIWKRLIESEKRNTQRLDTKIIRERVGFAFRQSLLCLRHLPEMWYEYAQYLIHDCGDTEQAFKVFADAIASVPKSLGLRFAFADFLENAQKVEQARQVFKDLLDDPALRCPLVYVHYLRFLQRTKGITEVRKVFLQLYRNEETKKLMTYQVVVALARMEYRLNSPDREKMAKRIFDIGFRRFKDNPSFILEYVKFLETVGDVASLRVLYERVFSSPGELDSGSFREVFHRYLHFEYTHGDVKTVSHVEQRYFEIYPEARFQSSYRSAVNRFRSLDLLPESEAMIQFIDGLPGESTADEELMRRRVLDLDQTHPGRNFRAPVVFHPDPTEMIEVTPEQLQNMIRNPMVDYELLNDPAIPAVAQLLPALPPLSGEQLPPLEIVLDTLQHGPLPTFDQAEKMIETRKRKREQAFGQTATEDETAAKRRKVEPGGGTSSSG